MSATHIPVQMTDPTPTLFTLFLSIEAYAFSAIDLYLANQPDVVEHHIDACNNATLSIHRCLAALIGQDPTEIDRIHASAIHAGPGSDSGSL